MKAEDARKLSVVYLEKQHMDLCSIEARIRNVASSGKFELEVDLRKIDSTIRTRIYENTAKYFRENGFEVRRNTYSEQRDGTYDDMIISW